MPRPKNEREGRTEELNTLPAQIAEHQSQLEPPRSGSERRLAAGTEEARQRRVGATPALGLPGQYPTHGTNVPCCPDRRIWLEWSMRAALATATLRVVLRQLLPDREDRHGRYYQRSDS